AARSRVTRSGRPSSGDEVDGYPAERRTASMYVRGTQIHSAYPVTAVVTGWNEAQHTFLEVYVVLVADCGHRTQDQRRPPLGRPGWVLGLHRHADHVGDHAGCDVVAPVASSPAPVIPLVGLVDRQNRSADVLRVQVDASDVRPARGENDSYIVLFNTPSHRIEISRLEDVH